LAQAMCGWQFRCCSLPEIDKLGFSSYLTEPECRKVTTQLLQEQLSEVRVALDDKSLTLDSTVAMSCIDQFAKGACSPVPNNGQIAPPVALWDRFAQCPNPFLGKGGPGSTCLLNSECMPGNSCTFGGSGNPSAGGVRPNLTLGESIIGGTFGHCFPDRLKGESCQTTSQCAPGLYCRLTDFVCASPAGDGEPCLEPRDNGGANVIASVIACAQSPVPLVCLGGFCRHLPQAGEPCLPQTIQEPVCDPSEKLGLSCVGIGFNGDGICAKAGQVGSVCSSQIGLSPCASSLACIGDGEGGIGKCAAPPGAGTSCSSDQRCAPPAVCYQGFQEPSCVVPPKARTGTRCLSDIDCVSLNCSPDNNSQVVPGVTKTNPGACVYMNGDPVCSGPGTFLTSGSNPPIEAPDGGLTTNGTGTMSPPPPPIMAADASRMGF
jgi:hypothetical protein